MKKKKNIIIGATASIAIYKTCELIRRLKEKDFSVTVVMTKEAKEFIRPFLFQELSGNRVYCDLFDNNHPWEMEHISLAIQADLVVIAPATANIIAKIASGLCDDLLTCVVSATKAPVIFCPAMNENMYLNKITQANIKKLESVGYRFVAPKKGSLACGKLGIGCLADIDTIISEVKKMAR
jgi:phosphopantothenoylcysteine decarboxylase/phosphopantothenate--cysteine ligase